jgi:DNA-binding transcriptional MerR regulator
MTDAAPASRYRIGDLARLAGPAVSTLRTWQERYPGLLRPARSTGGHRLCDDADLVAVQSMQQLVAAGRTVSAAATLVIQRRDRGLPASDGAPRRRGAGVRTARGGEGADLVGVHGNRGAGRAAGRARGHEDVPAGRDAGEQVVDLSVAAARAGHASILDEGVAELVAVLTTRPEPMSAVAARLRGTAHATVAPYRGLP